MSRPIRSMLFVPGDSDRKMEKALDAGADALVLDLEDSVMPANKAAARDRVAAFVAAHRSSSSSRLWVRVNPIGTAYHLADIVTVAAAGPAGILLPKSNGPEDVIRLGYCLDVLELRDGYAPGSIQILPVVTETAQAPFTIGRYAPANPPRLMGLTWGAEDLSSAIGASTNRDADGRWAETYRMVRSLCLLAAKACEAQCIETLYVDYRDADGLLESSRAARREGFTGRFAIHPAQVAPINEGFMPDRADVEQARAVIDAFAAAPDAATVGLNGLMLDIPHLNQARKVIALHDAFADPTEA